MSLMFEIFFASLNLIEELQARSLSAYTATLSFSLICKPTSSLLSPCSLYFEARFQNFKFSYSNFSHSFLSITGLILVSVSRRRAFSSESLVLWCFQNVSLKDFLMSEESLEMLLFWDGVFLFTSFKRLYIRTFSL